MRQKDQDTSAVPPGPVIGADYPYLFPWLKGLAPIDARTVVDVCRIKVSALNVWANRQVIPWLTTGRPGHARKFDIHFALHLAVTGELVDLGLSVEHSSALALSILKEVKESSFSIKALITKKIDKTAGHISYWDQVHIINEKDVEGLLRTARDAASDSYIVVHLARIITRLIHAATPNRPEP